MTTLLILVTGLSLAMAIAMSLVVLRILREERRRSDARVAALLEAADNPQMARPPVAPGTSHVAPRTSHVAPRTSHAPRRTSHVARDSSHVARDPDLALRPAAATPDLFVEPERPQAWGPRIAVAAGVLAILVGVGFNILSPGRATTTATVAVTAAGAPLELLTLRHSAEAGSLTVSGLVQNPKNGVPRRRAVATAFALAADGSVLATGRAPIDVATFGPGEESPFVVKIPVNGSVARYRIGFRAEDGGVIAHVDRRPGSEAVAKK